jgi:DNA-binding beta-propeller fold protein YncE/cytochrome c peroxidase
VAILAGTGIIAAVVYVGGNSGTKPGTTLTTVVTKVEKVGDPAVGAAAVGTAKLVSVSPRLVANGSDYPVFIDGEGLTAGMVLELYYGEDVQRVPTALIDDRHLTAVIPAGLKVQESKPLDDYRARLVGADKGPAQGTFRLTVVNDVDYPRPYALVRGASGAIFATSITTDAVTEVGGTTVTVADRPRALAVFRESLVVVHETDGTILVMNLGALDAAPRRIAGPPNAQDLAVDASSGLAYVTSRLSDAVHVIDLTRGEEVARYSAGINPGPVALAGEFVAVGNSDSGEVTLIERATGKSRTVVPSPNMPIIGGRSAGLSATIMGGTAPRDLVYSEKLDKVFVSNVGPNIGPNPKRVEVGLNGGITVVDPKSGTAVRHVSMLRGVPVGLAIDETRGLLYAADIATGRVLVFDATKLAATSDDDAAHALLGAVEIPAPTGIMRLRPPDEFGVEGRSTDSIHSGPRAIVLADDGLEGWVLNQFTGRVAELDLSEAGSGTLKVVGEQVAFGLGKQTQRRAGEVAFTTDLANSGLTCETCHLEGRGEGVTLTKPSPGHHIYRVSNLRGVRETPPYFTPPFYKSLPASSGFLSHIRFQNPPANPIELAALTAYQATLVAPPNPYRTGERGALPASIVLPDGKTGRPLEGLRLFEGLAECSTCHPAPVFSTDQDSETRGRTHDVGTPTTLALRSEMQDTASYPIGPPALVGVWDSFPLLHSGAGGFEVRGDRLATTGPFPLRRVFEMGSKHGKMAELDAAQVNDLLAYVSIL